MKKVVQILAFAFFMVSCNTPEPATTNTGVDTITASTGIMPQDSNIVVNDSAKAIRDSIHTDSTHMQH